MGLTAAPQQRSSTRLVGLDASRTLLHSLEMAWLFLSACRGALVSGPRCGDALC